MSTLRVIEGAAASLELVHNFIDSIDCTLDPISKEAFFSVDKPLIVTRAPGRLDVMGGIADYSGSLVLQLPIANATHVALQKVNSTRISILSVATTSDQRFIELDLQEFLTNDNDAIDYAEARSKFASPGKHWAAYVAGAFLVLMREKDFRFGCGARILAKSDVPEGKGVSSSAAIEVAAMQAIVVAFDIEVAPEELARLCQKVENLIAGAPCGIMDQMTAACGEEDRLLELLCQPDILKGTLALPNELELWGIDSGVRHSVGGSDYGTVRTAASMGYRIIAEIAGLPVSAAKTSAKVHIVDSKWNGYLANIRVPEFENKYATALPESLRGDSFLERYEGISDTVTGVDPDTLYPVLAATRHPIYEHERVQAFAAILKNWRGIEQASQLGALMFESHQSYSDCGLGSEATDLIASLVRESAAGKLFGARITGGGSGGTVAVLGRAGATAAIENVREQFRLRTGRKPLLISGSSAGARIFNHLKLEPNNPRPA